MLTKATLVQKPKIVVVKELNKMLVGMWSCVNIVSPLAFQLGILLQDDVVFELECAVAIREKLPLSII